MTGPQLPVLKLDDGRSLVRPAGAPGPAEVAACNCGRPQLLEATGVRAY
ncbi:hypothetical protein ACF059_28555 [Streptomyces sp. NPDC016562]